MYYGERTDSTAAVVMDGCLCSETGEVGVNTSERPAAAVRGRPMMTSRFSVFVCVGSAEVRDSESLQPHTHTHSDEDAQSVRLYCDAVGPPWFYLQKIN